MLGEQTSGNRRMLGGIATNLFPKPGADAKGFSVGMRPICVA